VYRIDAYFAILEAIPEFNPELGIQFKAPVTTERVLMSLYAISMQMLERK